MEKYAKKGDSLVVGGRLEEETWEDSETKKTRKRTVITVTDVKILPKRGSSAAGTPEPQGYTAIDDDVPF